MSTRYSSTAFGWQRRSASGESCVTVTPTWWFSNALAIGMQKDANMASYRFLVQQLCGSFEGYEFHHVPRVENDAADALFGFHQKIHTSRQYPRAHQEAIHQAFTRIRVHLYSGRLGGSDCARSRSRKHT